MLSRVADSIYWLNRYIERAEARKNKAIFASAPGTLCSMPPGRLLR
jgi:hypothetical protein